MKLETELWSVTVWPTKLGLAHGEITYNVVVGRHVPFTSLL
ncbi:MAG TPA: hypothetical protein VFW71_15145 [Actinomycetota bacterium]|nr:hypothetical protein [Actinomycetota bacterium]